MAFLDISLLKILLRMLQDIFFLGGGQRIKTFLKKVEFNVLFYDDDSFMFQGREAN